MNRDEYYNSLAHHQILGAKWGKRNGPPYPLNASSHSSSERKAGMSGWTTKAKAEARTKGLKTANSLTKIGRDVGKNATFKDREQIDSANKVANITDKVGEAIEKAGTKKEFIGKNPEDVKARYLDIDENEMRTMVKRLQLEKQYKELTTEERVNTGAVAAREALELVGSALVIGATAATIYNTVKKAKNAV